MTHQYPKSPVPPWLRTASWAACWALALLGAFGAATMNEYLFGNWWLAAAVPTLALCVIGLEAATAAGWAPGPFRPTLAWCALILNVATTGAAAVSNGGGPIGFALAAAMPLAFSPALVYAHALWQARCCQVCGARPRAFGARPDADAQRCPS